jgi:hypothetical protein
MLVTSAMDAPRQQSLVGMSSISGNIDVEKLAEELNRQSPVEQNESQPFSLPPLQEPTPQRSRVFAEPERVSSPEPEPEPHSHQRVYAPPAEVSSAHRILDEVEPVSEPLESQREYREKIMVLADIAMLRGMLTEEKVDIGQVPRYTADDKIMLLKSERDVLRSLLANANPNSTNIAEMGLTFLGTALEGYFDGDRKFMGCYPDLENYSTTVSARCKEHKFVCMSASRKVNRALGGDEGGLGPLMLGLMFSAASQAGTNKLPKSARKNNGKGLKYNRYLVNDSLPE